MQPNLADHVPIPTQTMLLEIKYNNIEYNSSLIVQVYTEMANPCTMLTVMSKRY